MRSAVARSALLFVTLLAPVSAHADVPAPNDHYCTEELQERDGSSCESCSVAVTDPSTAGACDALAARGWTVRCARGATVRLTIYCDRAADFVAVASGPARPPAPEGNPGSAPVSPPAAVPAANPAGGEGEGTEGAGSSGGSGGCAAGRGSAPSWAALVLSGLLLAARRSRRA